MKICPICRAQFNTKAALAQHMASVHPASQSRQRQRNLGAGPSRSQQSTITFSRSEFIGSVSSTSISLQPGNTGARQLDNIAAIFEQYRWNRLSFMLKSTVGSSANGLYFAGISYEQDHIPKTQADIASCSPCISHAVSKESTLQAPVRQLMEQQWLPTHSATGTGKSTTSGYFNLSSDQKMGLWMSYEVTFSGPTSVTRVGETAYMYSKNQRQWKYRDTADQVVTTTFPSDAPESLDIELDTSDPAVIDSVLSTISNAWQGFQESWRTVADGITYIHATAQSVSRVVLPVMTTAAIIHRRALPFRYPLRVGELRRDRQVEEGGCVSNRQQQPTRGENSEPADSSDPSYD